jgi:Tautomerase enzyme
MPASTWRKVNDYEYGDDHALRTYRSVARKAPAYRAALADIVYRSIVDVLKAPDGDRFIVINEHTADNLVYDPNFLGWKRSADFLLI